MKDIKAPCRYFAASKLFDGIGLNTAQEIIESAHPEYRKYGGGEVIFSFGGNENDSEKPFLGFVLVGRAYAEIPSVGGDFVLETYERGDIFGGNFIFTESARSYETVVRAKIRTEILALERDEFEKILFSYRDINRNFTAYLSDTTVLLGERIATLTSGNAEQALARYLLFSPVNDGICDIPSLSTATVMLNIGRATLYRALDSLVKKGVILRHDNGDIVIVDRYRLVDAAIGNTENIR